jgi:hypothetical protein
MEHGAWSFELGAWEQCLEYAHVTLLLSFSHRTIEERRVRRDRQAALQVSCSLTHRRGRYTWAHLVGRNGQPASRGIKSIRMAFTRRSTSAAPRALLHIIPKTAFIIRNLQSRVEQWSKTRTSNGVLISITIHMHICNVR